MRLWHRARKNFFFCAAQHMTRLPAPWTVFEMVGQERQLDIRFTYWVVINDGVEETIRAIKDYGPVLHGSRSDGEEVTFSPACVVRGIIG